VVLADDREREVDIMYQQVDYEEMAKILVWAWCSLFHRKHHEHIGLYRECHKCGSYVIRRDRKAERRDRDLIYAVARRAFERERQSVREQYERIEKLRAE